MKRYQRLANYFLHYYVTETIHTDEGRRDVERLFRKIIREAREDARTFSGKPIPLALNLKKLKKLKSNVILYRDDDYDCSDAVTGCGDQ